MTQPRDFGFNEDARMLRDAAGRFFREHFPADRLHRLVASDHDPAHRSQSRWDAALWREMVALGWHAVAVPERAGGAGLTMAAIVALVEEAGRAAFPSPLLSTIMTSLVLAGCNSPEADDALAQIVAGSSATLALINARGDWSFSATEVVIRGGRLSGTAWHVQDVQKADFLVVSAREASGPYAGKVGLYIVSADAEGVAIMPDSIVDLTRDQAHIEFRDVQVLKPAADPGVGDQVLQAVMPALLVLVAADMCGAAEWQLQSTVDYAKTRAQFDRPIGFFQAIKHPLVNVMVLIDQARSLLYNAACAIDYEPEQAELTARMAKASASDMAAYASQRAIQTHGGIGFTWECFQHIYFKRQLHNQQWLGDAAYQRARLADRLLGPITV